MALLMHMQEKLKEAEAAAAGLRQRVEALEGARSRLEEDARRKDRANEAANELRTVGGPKQGPGGPIRDRSPFTVGGPKQ